MRGASAIQDVLTATASVPARVLVVWEPVIGSDWAGLREDALRRISDPRAEQYWDEQRLVSQAMGGPERFLAPAFDVKFKMTEVVWDFVAVYPRGATWSGGRTQPMYAGGQVVKVGREFEAAIRRAALR